MSWLRIPLINASEHEIAVRSVEVREGQRIEAGHIVCVLESTKAAMELEAPCSGFVRALALVPGAMACVGDPVCAITATADEPLPPTDPCVQEETIACDRPLAPAREDGTRTPVEATLRARQLAANHGLDLSTLGVEGIVRARHVERALGLAASRPDADFVKRRARQEARLVILGAGGHARAVVDLIRASRPDLQIVGALDDGPQPPRDVLGIPVIGSSERLAELRRSGVIYAALGVGSVRNNALREQLYDRLCDAGFEMPSLIHPAATVERSAVMGGGNQIFAGAIVGSNVTLGDDTIINCNAVLSHDCHVEAHAHVTPGALLAGAVRVGRGAVIGMGATVYIGLEIGAGAVIPNGTAVFKNVPAVPSQLVSSAARSRRA